MFGGRVVGRGDCFCGHGFSVVGCSPCNTLAHIDCWMCMIPWPPIAWAMCAMLELCTLRTVLQFCSLVLALRSLRTILQFCLLRTIQPRLLRTVLQLCFLRTILKFCSLRTVPLPLECHPFCGMSKPKRVYSYPAISCPPSYLVHCVVAGKRTPGGTKRLSRM